MDDQPGGIAMHIAHLGQELKDFLAGGAMAERRRSSGSESVNVRQVLLKGEAIKEEQGVEGLILGAGRHPRQSQTGEKSLDFMLGGHQGFGAWGFEECRVAFEPLGVGFLGVEGEVLESASLSE
jgi:hypothetical protein